MQEREKKPFPTTVFYTVVTYQHSAKKKKKKGGVLENVRLLLLPLSLT